MAKRYDNWYVSKVDVGADENGRIQALERALTRPEGSKSKTEGKRLATTSLSRMKAIGIENLFLCPPDHKRYSRLLREQNKINKTRRLNKGDIIEILAEELKENENEQR
jgi:hypothetical protein